MIYQQDRIFCSAREREKKNTPKYPFKTKKNWFIQKLTENHNKTIIKPLKTFQYNLLYTSSTAQGGGGSFKSRKRIGEIDCCE